MARVDLTDEAPRRGAAADEWVFAAWARDGAIGCLSGHRLLGRTAWYWSAVVERGHRLLHLTEWEVRVRSDPFVVKAPEMWAEHHCVAPLEQWSVGNEGYFTALDDAGDAFGRAYGVPSPVSFDLEWYAAGEPAAVDHGYEQPGVVHGRIELADRASIDFEEAPAHRWRRWSDDAALGPIDLRPVVAHTGLRAPFAFPDGTVVDWVLTPDGWRARRDPPTRLRTASSSDG